MAIGKQGAYATVEGGIVDFGKITTEAIDKYQTQQALQEKLKQEKAAAAAKLKVEREKVEVKLDKFAPITGQGGISDLISQDLKEMADDISSTKEAYNNGEVSLAKVRAKEDAYNQRIFEYKSASDLSKTKSEDWAKNADKYDPQSLEESSDQFKALLSGNFQPGKDAQGKRVYQKVERDANGNVTKVLDEYYSPMDIVTKYNPIPKFNQAEDIHNFTTQIAPLSKYTDFSGLTKITSETIAGNPKVTENIKSYVGNLLSDPNTLAVLNKERTGTYKRTVTDPAEIKATADWYESKLKDGYKESVEKDRHYVSPTGGRDGSKTTFTPTTFDPSQSFGNYGKNANGLAITVSDALDKKNQVVLSTMPIGKGGAGGKISNALVTDVMYDDRGKMIGNITYVDWKSTKLTKEQKEKGMTLMQTKGYDDIDSIADELGVSSATLAESRKTLVQPLGESAKAKVLSKLGRSDAQLKKELGYSSTAKPTKTKTTTKKEINRGDIASKAQAAGYSVKEYEALLIKNGVTIK